MHSACTTSSMFFEEFYLGEVLRSKLVVEPDPLDPDGSA